MNRAALLQHLARAEAHIATSEKNVRRQRELVAELERDGHDVAVARKLLGEFEKLQAMHLADRDRIIRLLSQTPD